MKLALVVTVAVLWAQLSYAQTGHFTIDVTPSLYDNWSTQCDTVPQDSLLLDERPVIVEIWWQGALGRDSITRFGCARGYRQRFEVTTFHPGFYLVWRRYGDAGGTSCWRGPTGVIAFGATR